MKNTPNRHRKNRQTGVIQSKLSRVASLKKPRRSMPRVTFTGEKQPLKPRGRGWQRRSADRVERRRAAIINVGRALRPTGVGDKPRPTSRQSADEWDALRGCKTGYSAVLPTG